MFTGEPESYLLSKNLNLKQIQNMFKLKTRMVNVFQNFQNEKKSNKWCKLCFLFIENQQHLANCPKIREKLKGKIDFSTLDYSFISGSITQQDFFAKQYSTILETRDELLKEGQNVSPNGDQSTGEGMGEGVL